MFEFPQNRNSPLEYIPYVLAPGHLESVIALVESTQTSNYVHVVGGGRSVGKTTSLDSLSTFGTVAEPFVLTDVLASARYSDYVGERYIKERYNAPNFLKNKGQIAKRVAKARKKRKSNRKSRRKR